VSAVATPERTTARAGIDRPQRGAGDRALFDDGVTFEDVLLGVWEDLAVEGRATCLVCGGSMTADGCADCGSELA
jgi:hypothetical protein